MSNEIFRPQRPNVNADPEAQQFESNQGSHFDEAAPPDYNLDGGVKITGNVPPKMLEAMQKRKNSNKTSQREVPPSLSSFNTNVSSNLQNILESLKAQSNTFEEIVLPSLGKFYDGTDGPEDGKLHIRPMTGDEEEILATTRFVKKGIAINMIFSRCIQEAVKTENLLSVDRTFLLIYLRGISYGTEYEVEIKDPSSDRTFSTVIDLDTLEIETCPDDYGPDLDGILPKSGLSFTYRLSRGKDELVLQDYRDRKFKQQADASSDDSLTFRTAQLIEDIQGITDKNEIQILLRKLPILDVSYLRNLTTEPPFGIDTKVTILSPISSEDFEIELPLEANFFFPRGKRREKTRA